MNNGEKAAKRQQATDLLGRLQNHIDTLEEIYASGETAGLQETIQEMKNDAEDLAYMAAHVFALPRPR